MVTGITKPDFAVLDILKAGVYLAMLLCDTLAFKVIHFPFTQKPIAASGIIFVFSFAMMNTIANVYGFEEAKRTLFMTLFIQIIFCLVVNIGTRLK